MQNAAPSVTLRVTPSPKGDGKAKCKIEDTYGCPFLIGDPSIAKAVPLPLKWKACLGAPFKGSWQNRRF